MKVKTTKRRRMTTLLNGEEMRQFRLVKRYVQGFCGPTSNAEVLRFLVRNWANQETSSNPANEPSTDAFRAIIRDTKDSLPLTTSEEDLKLAVARVSWKMALEWIMRGR